MEIDSNVQGVINHLTLASEHLSDLIANTPRRIWIGKTPEELLAKARNLTEAAITNILMAVEPKEESDD